MHQGNLPDSSVDSYLGWFRMLDRSGPTGLQPALVLGAAMGNQSVNSIR